MLRVERGLEKGRYVGNIEEERGRLQKNQTWTREKEKCAQEPMTTDDDDASSDQSQSKNGHHSQVLDCGTNELHPRLFQLFREVRILAEEAVTRMYGLHAVLHAQPHDGVDVQIRRHRRFVGVQLEGLIRLVPMLGEAIFIFATNIYNVFSSHIVVSEVGGGDDYHHCVMRGMVVQKRKQSHEICMNAHYIHRYNVISDGEKAQSGGGGGEASIVII